MNRPLRLGFVPLTDCAPIVMARELGLYQKYGLNVVPHRELGWATIRDKIIHGELEAAHALAALPVVATLGLGVTRCDCLTGLVLNLGGNAITLSNELWDRGVRDATSLRGEIPPTRPDRMLTFGVVAQFSSHDFLLRQWLARAGIQPGRDARIVVVPPPQMPANLAAGHLDGFCAGEPWNSIAVQARAGWCAAAGAELAPGHPEKVLMVRRDFAEKRADEHVALLAALLDACEFCDQPENHRDIAKTLANPRYVGVAEKALMPGLSGLFNFGNGNVRSVPDFLVFHRQDANEPFDRKMAWVFEHLRAGNPGLEPSIFNAALGRTVFRTDIFEKAVQRRNDPPVTISKTQPWKTLSPVS